MNESTTYSESDESRTNQQPDEQEAGSKVNAGAETAVSDSLEQPLVDEDTQPQEVIPIAAKGTSEEQAAYEPRLMVVKRCDVGAVRDRNEDSCLVFVSETGGHFSMLPFGLYIVADGMGGHTNGHVASKIASRVTARHILDNIYLPLLHSDKPVNQSPIQEVLTDAVLAANTAVFEHDPEMDTGTTLTVALVLGRRLYVAHVGDSRLYLQSDKQFEAVTNDHSLVQRLQDAGQLTAEEATLYRYRNVLLRAVGQGEEVEIDTYMRLLPKKGKLLLCSDGLCGFVSDTLMREILEKEMPLQETADALYDAAMAAGGYDNITIILVEFYL